jgi:hypothetical protein
LKGHIFILANQRSGVEALDIDVLY